MKTGRVKFYNSEKGYGFITDDASGTEVFVHVSGLSEEVEQDDEVVFDTKDGKKGLNAINVRRS